MPTGAERMPIQKQKGSLAERPKKAAFCTPVMSIIIAQTLQIRKPGIIADDQYPN